MNAYGTNDDFFDWMQDQGLVLPDGADLDVLRVLGSGYVDSAYEHRLNCSKRSGGFDQLLAWPRTGHSFNGDAVPDDLIPRAWVIASYRAAYIMASNPNWATSGGDPNRKTKSEQVDVIRREFFGAKELVGTADVSVGMPADGMINGLVSGWLCSKARSFNSLFRVI